MYSEYQIILTVQSLRQVFLSKLQDKEDGMEQPSPIWEDALSSLDFTLQKAHSFNFTTTIPAAIILFEGENYLGAFYMSP